MLKEIEEVDQINDPAIRSTHSTLLVPTSSSSNDAPAVLVGIHTSGRGGRTLNAQQILYPLPNPSMTTNTNPAVVPPPVLFNGGFDDSCPSLESKLHLNNLIHQPWDIQKAVNPWLLHQQQEQEEKTQPQEQKQIKSGLPSSSSSSSCYDVRPSVLNTLYPPSTTPSWTSTAAAAAAASSRNPNPSHLANTPSMPTQFLQQPQQQTNNMTSHPDTIQLPPTISVTSSSSSSDKMNNKRKTQPTVSNSSIITLEPKSKTSKSNTKQGHTTSKTVNHPLSTTIQTTDSLLFNTDKSRLKTNHPSLIQNITSQEEINHPNHMLFCPSSTKSATSGGGSGPITNTTNTATGSSSSIHAPHANFTLFLNSDTPTTQTMTPPWLQQQQQQSTPKKQMNRSSNLGGSSSSNNNNTMTTYPAPRKQLKTTLNGASASTVSSSAGIHVLPPMNHVTHNTNHVNNNNHTSSPMSLFHSAESSKLVGPFSSSSSSSHCGGAGAGAGGAGDGDGGDGGSSKSNGGTMNAMNPYNSSSTTSSSTHPGLATTSNSSSSSYHYSSLIQNHGVSSNHPPKTQPQPSTHHQHHSNTTPQSDFFLSMMNHNDPYNNDDGDYYYYEGQQAVVDVSTLTPAQRRRYERNLREQCRSQRIGQQIKELMNALTDAQVPFKTNKFSVLTSVVDYIRQLQTNIHTLDEEQKRLIFTMKETLEMQQNKKKNTNKQQRNDDGDDPHYQQQYHDGFMEGTTCTDSMPMNYQEIFQECPVALSVAALDGRVLTWNHEFQHILGYSEEELSKTSIFHWLDLNDVQGLFHALGIMLKKEEEEEERNQNDDLVGIVDGKTATTTRATMSSIDTFEDKEEDFILRNDPCYYWSGLIKSKDSTKSIRMNITLARTAKGGPKFINCAATIG